MTQAQVIEQLKEILSDDPDIAAIVDKLMSVDLSDSNYTILSDAWLDKLFESHGNSTSILSTMRTINGNKTDLIQHLFAIYIAKLVAAESAQLINPGKVTLPNVKNITLLERRQKQDFSDRVIELPFLVEITYDTYTKSVPFQITVSAFSVYDASLNYNPIIMLTVGDNTFDRKKAMWLNELNKNVLRDTLTALLESYLRGN